MRQEHPRATQFYVATWVFVLLALLELYRSSHGSAPLALLGLIAALCVNVAFAAAALVPRRDVWPLAASLLGIVVLGAVFYWQL